MIKFFKALIPTIKQVWKNTRPKYPEPCPFCKDTGGVLIPVMQIGSMIEYEKKICHCVVKKK